MLAHATSNFATRSGRFVSRLMAWHRQGARKDEYFAKQRSFWIAITSECYCGLRQSPCRTRTGQLSGWPYRQINRPLYPFKPRINA